MKIKFRFSNGEERRKWRKIHSSFWEFSLLHISFVKMERGSWNPDTVGGIQLVLFNFAFGIYLIRKTRGKSEGK